MKTKTIWVVIDHPLQIVQALGLSLYFSNQYNVKLLISKHHYWKGVDVRPFTSHFDEVHWFNKADFSWIFPREIWNLWTNLRELNTLQVNSQDVFLILSDHTFLESLIISRFKNKKLALLPKYVYEKYHQQEFQTNLKYKERLISQIWNTTLIPFFRLEPLLYYSNILDKKMYALPYKRNSQELFHKTFFFDDTLKSVDNSLKDISPYLSLLNKAKNEKKRFIIFFGNSMHKHDKYQIAFTNTCLRYIEKHFPGYIYLYKPHPNDKVETKNISLGLFQVHSTKQTTELFLLEKGDQVAYFFAISSTSIKSCVHFGYTNAYYFFKLYKDYSNEFRDYLLSQFGSLTSINNMFIDSFQNKPRKYTIQLNMQEVLTSFQKIEKEFSA